MEVRIYDVEHGDCILITSSKYESVLVDCGYNSTTKWRPSEGLAQLANGRPRVFHHLILTHPDQDHLADLPQVLEKLKPRHVWQHPQLALHNIKDLKATLSKAQQAYLQNQKTTTELHPAEASRHFDTMELRQFYLPVGSVRDVNDLSLVSFITEDGFTVCLPGDLSARGWKLHMQNKAFQYMLRETNLLLASHHGRATGYYAPLFEYLYPKLIVISNKEGAKGRQQLNRAPYREHAKGVKVGDHFRRVLSTENDGRIRVVVKAGQWEVSTGRTTSSFTKPSHEEGRP